MKRIFFRSFAILIIFVTLTPSTHAISITNVPGMINQAFNHLGVNINEVRYAVRTFNESRQKKQAPQVTLSFEPTNPAPGEKIRATAQPVNFLNNLDKLYYTWYIKHASGNKDLNGDDKINIEDYKINAARIIASNGFDWERAPYTSDNDDDGYKAVFGGDDQRGRPEHCFYHDNKSGNEIEIACQHLFPDDRLPGDLGKGNFGLERELFWHTDTTNADTRGSGNTDEANVIGLGMKEFIWNYQPGDQIGVAVEGVSTEPAQTDDSAYKTMWALTKNKCSAFDDDLAKIFNLFPNTPAIQDETVTTVTTNTVDTQIPSPSDPLVFYTQSVVTEITTSVTTVVTSFKKITTVVTKTTTTVYTDPTKTTIVSGPTITTTTKTTEETYTTDKDINDCLDDNFIDPVEGGETNNIEVSLNSMPDNPVNDPSGENSDELVIQASTLNTKNKESLKYTWQVYGSNEPSPSSWGQQLTKAQMPGVTQTIGIGLSSFKMKLALQSPPKYLKFKVIVSEKTNSGVAREGHADVVIPLSSATNKINVYPARTKLDANNETILEIDTENELCKANIENVVCPVSQNEIIGLQVPPTTGELTNILWTIDNDPITPIPYGNSGATCLSGECNATTGEASNTAFFPILKEVGEVYTVNFSAADSTGQKLNISRTFEVVEPKVKLLSDFQLRNSDPKKLCDSAYTVCPILLGNYIDLDGTHWPDYNPDSFEAINGEDITIKANSNTSFTAMVQWYIDDVAITADNAEIFGATFDDTTLTFKSEKSTGEDYSVGYTALYTQPQETKKFLNTSYDVQLNEFYEKEIGHRIEISIVDSFDGAEPTAKAPTSGKILAAIITDVPTYLSFLIRIVLTSGLLLFVSWLILSLLPKNANE